MGVSPRSRLTLQLTHPAISFEGSAYHDTNWGRSSLEESFDYWTWSRAELDSGTLVIYDLQERSGRIHQHALLYDEAGAIHPIESLAPVSLSKSHWGTRRESRADHGSQPSLAHSLIDSPFYTRDLLETQLLNQRTLAMHEALDLKRFSQPWVRFLLPFRIRQQR